ncbi:MAG: HsdM family class I SAM-dependent methyltransferase [Ktedonobacteraceae bacterium]
MQSSNLFQMPELAYAPLPPGAYDAALESITRRGFSQNAILEEYSFSSANVKSPVKLNALAFAHPIHRNPGEYAGLTIYNAVNGLHDEAIVSLLAESAAPFHIIHRDEKFSFWGSTIADRKPKPIPLLSNISYDQLANALDEYAVDLEPQRIIDVKLGRSSFTLPMLREMEPMQLSFWAANVTRPLLVDYFTRAVNELRLYARRQRTEIPDETLTSLAIQLLGAIILADTGVLDDDIRLGDVSMRQLFERAATRFGRYFQPNMLFTCEEAAEQAYQILRQIRYSGFVPEMLASIYTAAFSKEQRKNLGRYDTPLYLTRRIWENIPVEYLPPQQRHVVDMTCGWGSFLIAGHERLTQLSDTPSSLRSYLHGNDIDPFTSQLAGLGLLLSTSEDSWHVDHSDALGWQWLETKQPNIIVGNPPFGSIQDSSVTGTDSWHEEANRYLALAIDRLAPNGYLAMLMPHSFTSSLASSNFRKQLIEKCDVLELWGLPIDVFPEARTETMVLFAQKKSRISSHSSNPVRVRVVQPITWKKLQTVQVQVPTFTSSGLVIDQASWNEEAKTSSNSQNTHIMDYYTILQDYIWKNIQSHSVNLQEKAEIFKGVSRGKAENRKTDHAFPPKKVSLLSGVKNVMPYPFSLNYTQAETLLYPHDLERPRLDKEYILVDTKVLVVYDPNPSWGKRNKLAIERKHHYPSDSFWVIAPNSSGKQQGITCEVLAAILNWDVSNAWIVEHLRSPAIPKRVMNRVPFPEDLSSNDFQMLTEAVGKIEEAAMRNQEAPQDAMQIIDTVLKAAYHLDEVTFRRLRMITEWDSKPQITLDSQPDPANANWSLGGVVKSIQAEEGTITLWMEGFHELQTVRIVPTMPGWMLRNGAAFRTKIPAIYLDEDRIDLENIDWGAFRPQSYTYMSEEELFADLSNLLHEDDRNRIF